MQSAYAVESVGAPKLSSVVAAPFSHVQARRLRGVVLMISRVRPAVWQFIRRPAAHNGTARAALVSPALRVMADASASSCRRDANAIRRPEFFPLRRSMVVLQSCMIAPECVVLSTALPPAPSSATGAEQRWDRQTLELEMTALSGLIIMTSPPLRLRMTVVPPEYRGDEYPRVDVGTDDDA